MAPIGNLDDLINALKELGITVAESTAGPSIMDWADTPHFFRAGNLIVLYVSNDTFVLPLLETVLGLQFAGGTSPNAYP